MTRLKQSTLDRLRGFALGTAACWITAAAGAPARAEDVRDPVGGLVVHVGCGAGERLIEMASKGPWLAHGLEKDEARIEAGRKAIRALGLCGIVTLEVWLGKDLPYADGIVNVLLADDPRVQREEALRVLAPGGVARLRGQTIRKPRPKEMDGWTHERHGADGNPVSRDEALSLPREIRWIAGIPLSSRTRPLTSDGIYYAGRNARDAFNGLPLWTGALHAKAAGDGRVFGFAGNAVIAEDATTGARVAEFGNADPKSGTLLYLEGRLVVATPGSLRVHDAKSGQPLWTAEVDDPRLAVAGGDRLFTIDAPKGGKHRVVCRELATGKMKWQSDEMAWLPGATGCSYGGETIAYEISPYKDDAVCGLHVLSTSTGKQLWEDTYKPPQSHRNQARAMYIGKELWLHRDGFTAVDPLTGKKSRTVPGGRGHCFPAIATVRFLIHGELNFTEIATGKMDANRITKGACAQDPYIPGNGLLYSIPKNCICFPMIEGYMALAPGAAGPRPPAAWESGGIERGPASSASWPREAVADASDAEWPQYRRDRYRSGGTPAAGPDVFEPVWRTTVVSENRATTANPVPKEWEVHPFVQGRITAPVVAGGRVFVAETMAGRITALNAASGRLLWQFTANGVVDTPPTIERGRCVFGTRAGWVYCLNAANGDLVWRLRAAPDDRRIVAWGALESAWPVPGSVLAHKGVIYFPSGRSPLADGGIHIFAVQVETGKIVQHQVTESFGFDQWYARLAHDYDPVDLLVFDGEDRLAMSRTRIRGADVCVNAGADGAFFSCGSHWFPIGAWSYGVSLRRQREKRPLYVFKADSLYGGEQPTAYLAPTKCPAGGGREWNAFQVLGGFKKKWSAGLGKVNAMAIGGKTLYVAHGGGLLTAVGCEDGKKLKEGKLPGEPVYDGLAIAYGRLYASLQDGQVVCLGGAGSVPLPVAGPSRGSSPWGHRSTPEEETKTAPGSAPSP